MSSNSKLGQLIGITTVAGLILAVANWQTINRWNIGGDLRDYARTVRRSQISVTDKEKLLDVIERLEDRIGDEQISWLDWRRHDDTLRDILRFGIQPEEVRLVERELQRVEKRLGE
jgi:hypothetical protein